MLIPATRHDDCEAALGFLTGVLEMASHAVFRDEIARSSMRSVALAPAC